MQTLMLLPIEHVLPYMMSNINSFSSNTPVPTSIIHREIDRLKVR